MEWGSEEWAGGHEAHAVAGPGAHVHLAWPAALLLAACGALAHRAALAAVPRLLARSSLATRAQLPARRTQRLQRRTAGALSAALLAPGAAVAAVSLAGAGGAAFPASLCSTLSQALLWTALGSLLSRTVAEASALAPDSPLLLHRAAAGAALAASLLLACLCGVGDFFACLYVAAAAADSAATAEWALGELRATFGPHYAWAVAAALGLRVARLLAADLAAVWTLWHHRAAAWAFLSPVAFLALQAVVVTQAFLSLLSLQAAVDHLAATSLRRGSEG